MLKFNILTLFPDLFTNNLLNLPFKKAIDHKLIEVNIINLRNFALDSYGTVDDKTYGGGVGMVLMVEPIFNALATIERTDVTGNSKTILLSPTGKPFTQKLAQEYSKIDELTFICGRYEGVDYRVEEHLATDVVSIGNYVVSGGELPALVIMESITRLLPGVLEKPEAAEKESFSQNSLEYPQYTRPVNFKGWKVPDILLSGNHKEIEKWRKENSKEATN